LNEAGTPIWVSGGTITSRLVAGPGAAAGKRKTATSWVTSGLPGPPLEAEIGFALRDDFGAEPWEKASAGSGGYVLAGRKTLDTSLK
jgi:hypothetical protein